MDYNWFSIGNYQEIKCARCGFLTNGDIPFDHHSSSCMNCEVTCIWFDMGENTTIQIISDDTSNEFKKFISWAQNELNELEFLELLVSFELIASAITEFRRSR